MPVFHNPDEPEGPEGDDPTFPRAAQEALLTELTEVCQKCGLYLVDADIAVMVPAREDVETGVPVPLEDAPRTHVLRAQFTVGKVALSPRVLDPVQDEINDQFRTIAVSDVDDEMKRIREQYQKDEKDE